MLEHFRLVTVSVTLFRQGFQELELLNDLPVFLSLKHLKTRHDGVRVRRPRVNGLRSTVCGGRQICPSGARPTVLDVYTDPNIPPLPLRVTTDQAKAIVSSMLKGDLSRPKPFFVSIGQAFKGIFYK